MTDNLGTGFCYTDQQLINICNENPHFTDEDRFFRSFFPTPEMTNSEDDKLLIAHITRNKVVAAPFSGKCAPAKVMEYRNDARELKEFDFANIHIKKRIELCRADDPALRVRDDGTFDDSQQSRFLTGQRQVAEKHRESVGLAEYKMMVDILFYGMTVIEGDDFPSYTVDLCRPEDHTIDLTVGGGLGFCDPCFDVFAWFKQQTRKMAKFGAVAPFDVVLGKDAATALAAHPQFRNWYEKCCANYTPPSVGTLANRAPETFQMTELFAADSAGKWRFWVNCGTVCELETDDAGQSVEVTRDVMPPDSVLIVNRRALRSRRMFAPIRRLFKRNDMFAGIRKIASPFWLSTKVDEECDSIDMHMWSKPLPIVGCSGATIFAKVVTEECVDNLCECPPLGMEAVEAAEEPATEAKAAKTAAAKTTAKTAE